MNRAEEVQLFRKSREVQVLRSQDDLVLSVLKAPLQSGGGGSTTVAGATTSEDDDHVDAEDSEKTRLQHNVRLLGFTHCFKYHIVYLGRSL